MGEKRGKMVRTKVTPEMLDEVANLAINTRITLEAWLFKNYKSSHQ
ncbi:hypothetical protein [Bacillus cereus]|nr:hypothetical protein [Bacillus cereus]